MTLYRKLVPYSIERTGLVEREDGLFEGIAPAHVIGSLVEPVDGVEVPKEAVKAEAEAEGTPEAEAEEPAKKASPKK